MCGIQDVALEKALLQSDCRISFALSESALISNSVPPPLQDKKPGMGQTVLRVGSSVGRAAAF
jgi:hypothetical protein